MNEEPTTLEQEIDQSEQYAQRRLAVLEPQYGEYTEELVMLNAFDDVDNYLGRAEINQQTVEEYRNVATLAKNAGNENPFPPFVCFRENGNLWLADGLHRRAAFEGIWDKHTAIIYEGGKDLATRYAISANSKHGNRPSNEDLKHNFALLLPLVKDGEDVFLSDEEIGRVIGASRAWVQRFRTATGVVKTSVKTKAGKTISTKNLGKNRGKGKTKPEGKRTKQMEAKIDKAVNRLETILKDTYPEVGDQLRTKKLNISDKDLLSWSDNSNKRVEDIAPFIVDLGRDYRDAESSYEHAKGKVTEKNSVGELLNFCIKNKGMFNQDVGDFRVTVEYLGKKN